MALEITKRGNIGILGTAHFTNEAYNRFLWNYDRGFQLKMTDLKQIPAYKEVDLLSLDYKGYKFAVSTR